MPQPITAFAPGEYETVIGGLRERGYEAVSLAELDPSKPHMFVRHDIDLCTDRALQLARREADMGIAATYFFLVSTELYSIASAQNRRILRDIIALGHDVGLHFDATQYPDADGSLDEYVEEECRLLELCSGQSVSTLSFHRPALQYLNRPGTIAGRRHCYEPAFFSDIGYISDSNGGWHHGHPFDHSAVAQGGAIQLLTHPIWWCTAKSTDTVTIIKNFHAAGAAALQQSLAATVTAYSKAIEPPSA